MLGMVQSLLDVAVLLLLAVTLFHALRLRRALGVLSRDRPALEALVAAFNVSTQQAENGIERLRGSAEGVGRAIARQNETALALKDDLAFLVERGDRLANRLDLQLRAAPLPSGPAAFAAALPAARAEPVRHEPSSYKPASYEPASYEPAGAASTRVRSQAERDLLHALRTVR